MEKNERYIATATSYSEDGAGVTRINGIVIFVPSLLNGEEAEIGITKMKKNYGYGRIIKILKPSLHRIDPTCSVYKQCGGCQLQHMDSYEQNTFKENKVKDCFHKIAGMNVEIQPIIKVEPYWNYRNKVQIPVQCNDNKVEMGFYAPHSNRIVQYDVCHVQTDLSNELTNYFRKQFDMLACGQDMRHVLIKHAHNTGEVMVALVVRNYPFHNSDSLIKDVLANYPQIKSLVAIVNKREDNVILDGEEILLAGRHYIEEELLDCTFRISARSFYQINPYATRKLYSKAIELAGLTGNETLIDLYCGTGTMGIIAAKQAKQVYGIEIVADAIRDANTNAENNNITNIKFINADASEGAQQIIKSKIQADAMIIDPPRKGCSKDTIDAIVTIAPKKLVYVSCDPATLARDIKILSDNGYKLELVQPVDLFPQTVHVETVALLSKLDVDKHIDVEIKLDELDLTSAESKATYAQIKKYILEKFDLKVSTLYIAQIKKKCGIALREHYNKSKKEKQVIPQCTPEKEEAIMDALRHFKMI